MTTSLRPEHEALLRHTEWVRGLARGLVADAGAADDLVQETWLAALTRPPQDQRNVRGWLRTVLHNTFRQRARAEGRRRERERAVARPEGRAPEHELLERAQLHGRLVEVLTEVEEPFRTALLLRYFEGLGPAEIAERVGVPLDTARSRLRRGLERMRARLDAQTDGDRAAWLAAVAPLALPPSALPPLGEIPVRPPVTSPILGTPLGASGVLELGALAMKIKLAALCVLLVAGALVLTAILNDTESPANLPVQAAGAPEDEPAEPASAPVVAEAVAGRETIEPAAEAAAAPPEEVVAASRAMQTGLVLGGDGAPVVGAVLSVRSDEGTTRAESGPGGQFDFPAPDGEATIRSADERYATVLAAHVGDSTEGDAVVVVAPAVDYRGRVVDETGRAVLDARVELVVPRSLQLRIERVLSASIEQSFVTRTKSEGEFALADVPGVEEALLAVSANGFADAELELSATGDTALLVELTSLTRELGAVQGRVVNDAGEPVAGAHVSAGGATQRTDGQGEFAFDAETSRLAGELVALHPGHLPARVEPYTSAEGSLWPDYVVLTLEGETLSISGRAVNEAGQPQAGVWVWIDDPTYFGKIDDTVSQMENVLAGGRSWRELEERDASIGDTPNGFWSWSVTDQNGRFELTGLLDREYRLKGMRKSSLTHAVGEPVRAGTTDAELVLATARHRDLHGAITTPDGFPVQGARVRTTHRAVAVSHGEGTVAWDVSGPETETGDDGRFVLPNLPDAGVRLIVTGEGFRTEVLAESELDGVTEVTIPVELASDRCYFRIELEETSLADRFELRDPDGQTVQLEFRRGGYATSTDRAFLSDGVSFVLSVPEGTYELVLFLGEDEVGRESATLLPGPVTVLRPRP